MKVTVDAKNAQATEETRRGDMVAYLSSFAQLY